MIRDAETAAVILALTVAAYAWLPSLVVDVTGRRGSPTFTRFAGHMTTALIILIGASFTAGALHLTSLQFLSLSAISFTVGLAFQSLLTNIVAGFAIAADRRIEIGRWIETSGKQGTITDMGARVTEIRTADGDLFLVPNSLLENGMVGILGDVTVASLQQPAPKEQSA